MAKTKTKPDNSSEPRIVKYQDKDFNFAFSKFWKNRDYDHRAEEIILKKYFKKYFSGKDNKWLIDVGGGFGRLLPVYAPYFKEITILDYAVNEFHEAKKTAQEKKIKLHLLAANAYHLPISDNSQSAIISVRLIHHLEDPFWFFEEISRVLKPGGIFICHAANKNNLKNLLRAIVSFDFSIWRLRWVDIGEKGVQNDGSFLLIRNYKPSYLEGLLKELNLKIEYKRSTSWLRNMKFLQRIPGSMYLLERPLQWVSGLLPLGPSNWYVITKEDSGSKPVKKGTPANFLSTLCLPVSKKHLLKSDHSKYLKKTKKNVDYLDLRYPKN